MPAPPTAKRVLAPPSRPLQTGLVLLVLLVPSVVLLWGYHNDPGDDLQAFDIPDAEQTRGPAVLVNLTEAHVAASLGRPLCLVLVMGSGIDLAQHAMPLQQRFLNCFFHLYSPVLLVPNGTWPPPPPYAFYHHSYFLVDDHYDTVGPLVDARPLVLDLLGHTVDPDGMASRQLAHEPLKASTVFGHYELNRLAAVIAHLGTIEDEVALKDALFAITEREGQPPIDLVIVQRPANGTRAGADWLQDREYGGYAQWDNVPDKQHGAVYYVQPDMGQDTSHHPQMTTMIGFGTFAFGRVTNQIIQDSRIIAYFGELCANRTAGTWPPICDRAFVPNEASHLHDGAHLTMYNISRMYDAGFLPNRLLSPVELVTIETLAFCSTSSRSLRYITRWDGLGPQETKCEHYLPTALRAPHDTKAFTPFYGGENDYDWPNLDFGMVNDTKLQLHVHTFHFKVHWVDHNEYVRNMGWLSFSNIIDDLARRQQAVYEARARRYWNISDPATPLRFVSMHLRFTDYDDETNGDRQVWSKKLNESVAYLANTTSPDEQPVHGIIFCSDDPKNSKFKELNSLFPNVPKFDCVGDIIFDRNRKGFVAPVIQQTLSFSACFIGLRPSSFAERIIYLREARAGYTGGCDHLLGNERNARRRSLDEEDEELLN